jgi:hypothetical protein
VAEDRCAGYHVDVAPPVLETELTAEIEEVPILLEEGKLLDAGEVVVAFLPLLKETSDFRYLVARGVGALDDAELLPGGVEMGGVDDPLVDRIVGA